MSSNEVFVTPIIKEILRKYRVIWAIGHASALMGWDLEVCMPPAGVKERSAASAELGVLSQKLLLDPEFVSLVEKAAEAELANDYERGLVRVLKREIDRMRKIPPEVLHELIKTTGEAQVVWREAKQRSDFGMFRPYLEKIVELERRIAEYLGYEEHPYDALLDFYEEGVRVKDLDPVFQQLEPELRKIIEKVLSEGRFPQWHPLEDLPYRKEDLKELNLATLELLGYPLGERARLDESTHPFTQSIGVNDVRITTRYEGKDFRRSYLAVIHEFGHALYELQIDERLAMTPLATGASLGIHESQSRFWENIIGRSRAFVTAVYPLIEKHLPFVSGYGPDEVFLYFNVVRPSLIRVEADEVTYNMHIILRYRLEKALIEGSMDVSDLPSAWNDLMDKLLGVRPRNDAEGVLQDIHWSMGSIGYFPTYTLGTLAAAQIAGAAEKELGSLEELVREKGFGRLREWLREKIHRWGATYPPKELLRRVVGSEYSAEPFIGYIRGKYLA